MGRKPMYVQFDKPVMVPRICKRCHEEFDMPIGWWKYTTGKHVYCSRKCQKADEDERRMRWI